MRPTLQPVSEEEADADYAARLAWWKENQEPLLRPGRPPRRRTAYLRLRNEAAQVGRHHPNKQPANGIRILTSSGAPQVDRYIVPQIQ